MSPRAEISAGGLFHWQQICAEILGAGFFYWPELAAGPAAGEAFLVREDFFG